MLVKIQKGKSEKRIEARREMERHNKLMVRETQKIKQGKRNKNAGFSEGGYNFGLGEYVKNKADYKRIFREKQASNPSLHENG